MSLRGELGRADIRDPYLNGAEPLGAETLAMLADSLGNRNGGAATSHATTLHVTQSHGNRPHAASGGVDVGS